MKYMLSFIPLFLVVTILAGCTLVQAPGTTAATTQATAPNTAPTQASAPTLPPEPTLPEGRELTSQELKELQDLFMYDLKNPENNWYNYALKSVYETPAQLDLLAYFYSAPWAYIGQSTEDEAFLREHGIDSAASFVHEYPVRMMNEILNLYFGITLGATDKVGLDQMIYHPETNAYYHCHGDMSMAHPKFKKGVQTPDGNIVIYYKDVFVDMYKILTITPREDGGYRILSNVPAY